MTRIEIETSSEKYDVWPETDVLTITLILVSGDTTKVLPIP